MRKVSAEKLKEIFDAPEEKKPDGKKYTVFVYVTRSLFGRLYFASQKTGWSMSKLAFACIDGSLDDYVIDILDAQRRGE